MTAEKVFLKLRLSSPYDYEQCLFKSTESQDLWSHFLAPIPALNQGSILSPSPQLVNIKAFLLLLIALRVYVYILSVRRLKL